jgi:hypothetical protein
VSEGDLADSHIIASAVMLKRMLEKNLVGSGRSFFFLTLSLAIRITQIL